ncbi:MAG TPA: hypothetical protein VG963_27260 [Polyangiaceae bacterium]|nr:hypothetical protein [Polyangiaceae bacterium]
MSRKARTVPAIAAGALALFGAAHAQDGGKVMIDVTDCIKLDAPESRLACYEARVAAVFGQRAAQAAAARPTLPAVLAAAPPPAPAAVPAPPASVAPAAGMPAASASPSVSAERAEAPGTRHSRREERRQEEQSATAGEIVSRVKELREIVPNSYLVTLENGQVWRQSEPKQYPLRPGMQVRVYGTRWGTASRLSADEIKSYIQVERVR